MNQLTLTRGAEKMIMRPVGPHFTEADRERLEALKARGWRPDRPLVVPNIAASSRPRPARPAGVSLDETLATLANVRRTLDRLEEPALARPSKPSRGLPPAEKAELDRRMGLAGPEVSSDPARFTLSRDLDLRALEQSRPRKLSAAARAELDRKMRVSEPSSGVRNEGCRLILGGVK